MTDWYTIGPDSHIERIPDYIARLGASIDGVVAIAATGTGGYPDPLRPGYDIVAYQESNKVPGMWAVNMPSAPALQWLTQEGIVELTWKIPSRYFLDGNDPISTRMQAAPMYNRILRAFVRDHTLGGLALRSQITALTIGDDKDWAWLQSDLLVVEQVNYTDG